MRLKVLRCAAVLLCAATTARPSEPVEIVTAQITSPVVPAGDSTYRGGLQLGATLGFPLPGGDISNAELGVNAGVVVNWMGTPDFAVGLDVAYHYWPASDEFKADFNKLLRNETLGIIELGGTGWNISALQATGHLKFLAPIHSRVRPWLQIGGGVYRVDPHTTGFEGDAGFFTVSIKPFKVTSKAGFCGAAGVEFKSGSSLHLGLEASFDHVLCKDEFGSDFVAWALGGHILFGR
jgi:hypothetical protein